MKVNLMKEVNLVEQEIPEQTAHLDSIVHSGTDALVLGCIDQVGRITYREAIRLMQEKGVA